MKKILVTALVLFCLAYAGTALANEYVLGQGDILSIRVWGEDTFGADVIVRPDGKISMPGVDDIQAAGLTPLQLQKRIAAKLTAFVNAPMVTVMVHSSSNNAVLIHGSGTKSGVMPLDGKTTLLELLSKIGPDYGADLENAYVARGDAVVVSNLRELYEKGSIGRDNKNIELRPGDRIFIPLRKNRLVHVVGAVGKPSSFPCYEGMTVLEAIHLAGGYTKFAARNDTVIVRESGGAVQHIPVRGSDLIDDGDLAQNVPVQGGDYILVKKGWF